MSPRHFVCLMLVVLLFGASAPSGSAAPTPTVFQDDDFLATDWEQVVDQGTLTGSVGLRRVASGGAPGAYQEIALTGYGIGFQIYTAAAYDPAVRGEIRELDYRELARSPQRQHRIAPAVRQSGKVYAAYSSSNDTTDYLEPTFTTVDPNRFHEIRFFGLRAEHFRTTTNANDHPDFSASGAPIEFGSFRAFSPQVATVGDMDGFEVTVNPALRLALTDEIRAEASGEVQVVPNSGHSDLTLAVSDARAPLDLTDQVAITTWGIQGTQTVNGVNYSRASLATGLGCRSDAVIPAFGDGIVQSVRTASRASHRRKFVALWGGSGPPPANVPMDVLMFAHGTLQTLDLGIDNPVPDHPNDLWAEGRASIVVSRITSGAGFSTITPYSEWVRRDGLGNVTASAGWSGSHTADVDTLGRPRTLLSSAQVLNDLFTVPFGEEFAIEFVLETEAYVHASVPQHATQADFANTLSFEVQTDTPDVTLVEVRSEVADGAAPGELDGKRTTKLGKLVRRKGRDPALLSFGGGRWSVDDGGKLRLGGTYDDADPAARKHVLALDDAARDALLAALRLDASDAAGEDAVVALDPAKPPKLLYKVNKKGTKAKLVAKLRLLTTVGDTTEKGAYSLTAKGAPPAASGE